MTRCAGAPRESIAESSPNGRARWNPGPAVRAARVRARRPAPRHEDEPRSAESRSLPPARRSVRRESTSRTTADGVQLRRRAVASRRIEIASCASMSSAMAVPLPSSLGELSDVAPSRRLGSATIPVTYTRCQARGVRRPVDQSGRVRKAGQIATIVATARRGPGQVVGGAQIRARRRRGRRRPGEGAHLRCRSGWSSSRTKTPTIETTPTTRGDGDLGDATRSAATMVVVVFGERCREGGHERAARGHQVRRQCQEARTSMR